MHQLLHSSTTCTSACRRLLNAPSAVPLPVHCCTSSLFINTLQGHVPSYLPQCDRCEHNSTTGSERRLQRGHPGCWRLMHARSYRREESDTCRRSGCIVGSAAAGPLPPTGHFPSPPMLPLASQACLLISMPCRAGHQVGAQWRPAQADSRLGRSCLRRWHRRLLRPVFGNGAAEAAGGDTCRRQRGAPQGRGCAGLGTGGF